jgi:hypothetical protein
VKGPLIRQIEVTTKLSYCVSGKSQHRRTAGKPASPDPDHHHHHHHHHPPPHLERTRGSTRGVKRVGVRPGLIPDAPHRRRRGGLITAEAPHGRYVPAKTETAGRVAQPDAPPRPPTAPQTRRGGEGPEVTIPCDTQVMVTPRDWSVRTLPDHQNIGTPNDLVHHTSTLPQQRRMSSP